MITLQNKQKKTLPVIIFSFFFLIYLTTSGGHTDPTDGPSYFLMSENFVKNGHLSLNINSLSAQEFGYDIKKQIDFKTYQVAVFKANKIFGSWQTDDELRIERNNYLKNYMESVDKENVSGAGYIILPFIISPLIVIADLFQISEIVLVSLIANSAIIASIAVLIFLIGSELYKSEKIGFVLSLIFAVSTFIWPYITSLYANPLAILFTILGLFCIIRQKEKTGIIFPFIGGIVLGLAVLSHTLFLIQVTAIFIFGVYEFRKKKNMLIFFVVGFIIMMIVQGVVNEYRFGSYDEFGFSGGIIQAIEEKSVKLGTNISSGKLGYLEGIGGFLFSPGYSIFIYLPIFVLAPISWYFLFKKYKSLTLLLIFMTLIMILYVGQSSSWNANPSWGAHRHLLPMIAPTIISIGILISNFHNTLRLRLSIILLSVSGFLVNLTGNLVWVQYAYSYGWGPEGLWKLKIEQRPDVFTWDPGHSLIIQNIKVLTTNWVATLNPNPIDMDYFRIGLNGCSYDIYFYCEYGIGIILLLAVFITMAGFAILDTLKKQIIN